MSNTRTDDRAGRLLRPEVVARLDGPPGPNLLRELHALAAEELSARERVEVVKGWRSMAAHCAAGQLDAVAALDRAVPKPERSPESLRPAADEIAPAVAVAPAAASRLVGLARRLDRVLPAAADALADGRMDLAQARLLAALTRDVPDPSVVDRLEQLAVQQAPRLSVVRLRRLLRTELARLLPGWSAAEAAAGREAREVQLLPSPLPGCRRVVADLPLVDATAVWLAVNGVAVAARARGLDPAGDPEKRTLPQLRADSLVSILTGLVRAPDERAGDVSAAPVAVPTRERLAELAEVQVVVAADTLLGQSVLPGALPDGEPVDVREVGELAACTRWRRLLAEPVSGTLLDRGTTVYRPPAALRRHVVARDGTCAAEGCTEPAVTAELDHTVNFGERGPDGTVGTTADHNLDPACDRHHYAKTHLGWRLQQPERGRFRWTSPTGCQYETAPRPLLPGWAQRRPEWGQSVTAPADAARREDAPPEVAQPEVAQPEVASPEMAQPEAA